MAYSVLVVITQNKNDSLKAIQKAIEVAKEVRASKLRLLYMYPIESEKPNSMGIQDHTTPLVFQDQLVNESEVAFQTLVELLEQDGIPYEKYIGIGNLIHEIRIQSHIGRCQLVIVSPNQIEELTGESLDLRERLACPVFYV